MKLAAKLAEIPDKFHFETDCPPQLNPSQPHNQTPSPSISSECGSRFDIVLSQSLGDYFGAYCAVKGVKARGSKLKMAEYVTKTCPIICLNNGNKRSVKQRLSV
jgi:hypothetical protein